MSIIETRFCVRNLIEMGDAYQGVFCRFYVVEEPVLPGVLEVINVLAGLDVKPSSERRPCMPMESRKWNVFTSQ